MPRVTWNTRDAWLPYYSVVKNEVVVTYGDDTTWAPSEQNPELLRRADALIARGIQTADRVLVAGAGLGYLVQAMEMRGLQNVWGLDNSTWVQSRKSAVTDASVVLINADLGGGVGALRTALTNATGARTFDWVITESLLESFDDAEITTLLNVAEGLLVTGIALSHLIHVVYTPPFNAVGVFNEKTMAQWKAMRSTHTWMNAEGYGVA